MKYIIIYAGPIQIIGPFENMKQLVAYGRAWQRVNFDDPRWNEIDLDLDPSVTDLLLPITKP